MPGQASTSGARHSSTVPRCLSFLTPRPIAADLLKKSWKLTSPDFQAIQCLKLLRSLINLPMQHLDLSPLPCAVPSENSRHSVKVGLGFVDDAVVLALLTGNVGFRFHQCIESLALAADEMDYAGWPPSVLQDARFTRRDDPRMCGERPGG